MKFIRKFIHPIIMLVAIHASGTGLLAQNLESILEEHYRAASQEKMAKMETMVTRGKSVFTSINMESPFTLYRSRPDKVRVESEYQGFRVVQTYNGEQGWIYAPGMGIPEPRKISGEELEMLLNQSAFENPLWNYEKRGYHLALVNESGKTEAYQLKITMKDGGEVFFFIDKKSQLITSYTTRQVLGGAENEIEVILDEYKNVKGIPVAHRTVTRMNGQVVTTVRVEDVEFNKKLDPSLFEKPARE